MSWLGGVSPSVQSLGIAGGFLEEFLEYLCRIGNLRRRWSSSYPRRLLLANVFCDARKFPKGLASFGQPMGLSRIRAKSKFKFKEIYFLLSCLLTGNKKRIAERSSSLG